MRRENGLRRFTISFLRVKNLAGGGDGRLGVEAAQSSVLLVGSGKEMQEWNEQKLPKVLAGYSGGRC